MVNRRCERFASASPVATSLRRLIPVLAWRPVPVRCRDGRLRLTGLELPEGRETAELKHCGCAAESPDDPKAYCDDCLPWRVVLDVNVRAGIAEFLGEVYFGLVEVRKEDGTRIAVYDYWI